MNQIETKKKFYWLWAAIGLLLSLNVATVGWVMHKVDTFRTSRQNPEAFLARQLALSPAQLARYQQSRRALQQQMAPHQDSLHRLRSELIKQVKTPTMPEEALTRLLDQMARHNEEITRLRFRHWRQVRAICTADQQATFDRFLNRLDRSINGVGRVNGRERFRPQ